ncbi:MAG: methyltransferase domain-containing protein [Chloroflexi bacterium]|nr:methyltransferase domain-containing protein [Chloroflexota bacterium]
MSKKWPALADRLSLEQKYFINRVVKSARYFPIDTYFHYKHRAEKMLPLPPVTLRHRVSGVDDIGYFHYTGLSSHDDFQKALNLAGYEMSQFRSILDFGAGCGRIMRWMKQYSPPAELYGTDIDIPAIRWSQKKLTFATFDINQPLPPLVYPANQFDYIYSHSVFTHLDDTYQDAWLAELNRVTKPGAILTLTVHGKHAFDHYISNAPDVPIIHEQHQHYQQKGFLFVSQDSWQGIFPAFYRTMFHQESYVRQHWSDYFEVLNYIDQGMLNYQAIVVLRKR